MARYELSTATLRDSNDFVRYWDEIQALKVRLGVRRDVLLDPVHFLTAADEARRPCAVACWQGLQLIGILYAIEHCVGGIGTGYAIGGDFSGRGLLMCMPQDENVVLRECVKHLTADGIHSLHLRMLPSDKAKFSLPGLKMTFLDALIPGDRLELQSTYEQFLSTLGKHTRRNIRAYTRKTEAAGIRFVAGLTKQEYEAATERLNAETQYRADPMRLARDERLLLLHGDGERLGLRAPDGNLIAVLCGFRRDGRFHLLTQLNDVGYGRFSLSIVLRGYAIEHFIATGYTQLQFMGGSSLTFGRYCQPEVYRSIFIDRRIGLAAAAKQVCSKVVGMIAKKNIPVPEILAVISSGHLEESRLSERTALRPAAILFEDRHHAS
jgi:hypothetical protein